jgi:hypothetical protein
MTKLADWTHAQSFVAAEESQHAASSATSVHAVSQQSCATRQSLSPGVNAISADEESAAGISASSQPLSQPTDFHVDGSFDDGHMYEQHSGLCCGL